ncbi:hypothetical protein niasHS_003360 [Heterodera schachtii]|uniref:Uncharacterized protein n=1 Tax=Heterodera schachtii TaxID=97005 RepID=A0ABD2KGC2_HETSC
MKERDGPTDRPLSQLPRGMITQFRSQRLSFAFPSARPTFIRSKTYDQRNDEMANWPFNKNAWANSPLWPNSGSCSLGQRNECQAKGERQKGLRRRIIAQAAD